MGVKVPTDLGFAIMDRLEEHGIPYDWWNAYAFVDLDSYPEHVEVEVENHLWVHLDRIRNELLNDQG